jgi:hypothetical protein
MTVTKGYPLDTRYIRIGLIKSVGLTNIFISEKLEKNISLVNREINGFGGRKDYIRKYIWREFCKRAKSKKITYERFWASKFEI